MKREREKEKGGGVGGGKALRTRVSCYLAEHIKIPEG